MRRNVAIVGTGQTKYVTRRNDVSFPELAWEAAKRALDDAELGIDDVDAVVFATAPEAFEGVNCPDKWAADAIGAMGKPFMRINTGGATGSSGAHAGIEHVASNLFDVVLVLAIQRVGQTPDAQRILNLIWDPVYASSFPLNLPTTMAMTVSEIMEQHEYTEYHMARISVKNHDNGMNNKYAHIQMRFTVDDVLKSRVISTPLKLLDCCPRSDGACSIIVASEERAKKITETPAWVKGISSETNIYTPGQELISDNFGVTAVRTAYEMAGIDNPRKQIDVVEPYDPFSYMEMLYYLSMGFAKDVKESIKMVENGFGEMDGEIPFSPSGGVMCSNPIGATALVRVAEAALQVMGKAEGHQVPEVRTAMATGVGGSPGPGSATFFNATILSKEL